MAQTRARGYWCGNCHLQNHYIHGRCLNLFPEDAPPEWDGWAVKKTLQLSTPTMSCGGGKPLMGSMLPNPRYPCPCKFCEMPERYLSWQRSLDVQAAGKNLPPEPRRLSGLSKWEENMRREELAKFLATKVPALIDKQKSEYIRQNHKDNAEGSVGMNNEEVDVLAALEAHLNKYGASGGLKDAGLAKRSALQDIVNRQERGSQPQKVSPANGQELKSGKDERAARLLKKFAKRRGNKKAKAERRARVQNTKRLQSRGHSSRGPATLLNSASKIDVSRFSQVNGLPRLLDAKESSERKKRVAKDISN